MKALFFLLFFHSYLIAAVAKPNVVFLLVDDLGWADFGCYGAKFYETPNIDKLAAQGMRFTHAYSACTVCSPSRAAILTGCYPARIHLTDWIAGHKKPQARLKIPDWKMKIDHERILLPEALKEGGYATGFFGKWHLMPDGAADFSKHYPTDHGFDCNIGGREWGQPKGPGKYFAPFGMPNLNGKPGEFLTDALTDQALAFMEKHAPSTPFFLYLSYYTLHSPLMAPADLEAKYRKKAQGFDNRKKELLNPQRAGMVECLDRSVGRIRAKLDELGLTENTIIILTGDNGGDHQEVTGGLSQFKGFSHEGGVRVPLIAQWSGKIPTATICEKPVIGTDFYPTILDLTGLPARPEQHADGLSISSLLRNPSASLSREAIYWHYPHYHRTNPYGAIRKGDWKLIEFFEDGSTELYDLKADPFEKNNLAKAEPERAESMRSDLVAWRKSVAAQMPTPNPNYQPVDKSGNKKKKKSRE